MPPADINVATRPGQQGIVCAPTLAAILTVRRCTSTSRGRDIGRYGLSSKKLGFYYISTMVDPFYRGKSGKMANIPRLWPFLI
jgi:hypothetical protein